MAVQGWEIIVENVLYNYLIGLVEQGIPLETALEKAVEKGMKMEALQVVDKEEIKNVLRRTYDNIEKIKRERQQRPQGGEER